MSDRLFERAVLDWLEDGSDRTPRPAIDAVLLAVKTTPQERDRWIPRRFPLMTNSLRAIAGIAIVAIVAIGVIAFNGLRSGIGTASPAPPSAAAPTVGPTAGPTLGPTVRPTLAFTGSMSSAAYGYDARYPEGWRVGLGSVHGSASELAFGEHAAAPRFWDHLTPPGEAVVGSGILGTSTVVPPGVTEDAWIDEYQAPQVKADGRACIPQRSTWAPITVDGHEGGVYAGCNYAEAMLFVGDRVYVFYYVSLTGASGTARTEGLELLKAFLATVTIHPERATVASPAPS